MARQTAQCPRDPALHQALQVAYLARARLFRSVLESRGLDALIAEVRDMDAEALTWDDPTLRVSAAAREKVRAAGIANHWVFCHPEILARNPRALDYYRIQAAVSAKGLQQIVTGLTGQERAAAQAAALNTIISAIVEDMPRLSTEALRDLMLAEAGSEIQGTWVNSVGQGAARRVQEILEEYARTQHLIVEAETPAPARARTPRGERVLHLKKGWRLVFASEPDVGIYDPSGRIQCAIEIKGSLDRAGAQTRYGEAKKSFGKALSANPHCETVYLHSCATPAVTEQVKGNGTVRQVFNLVDILVSPSECERFLLHVFHYATHIKV